MTMNKYQAALRMQQAAADIADVCYNENGYYVAVSVDGFALAAGKSEIDTYNKAIAIAIACQDYLEKHF